MLIIHCGRIVEREECGCALENDGYHRHCRYDAYLHCDRRRCSNRYGGACEVGYGNTCDNCCENNCDNYNGPE